MKRSRWIIAGIILLIVASVFLPGLLEKEKIYQAGLNQLREGRYSRATQTFESLQGYRDSHLLANQAGADELFALGDYAHAWSVYTALPEKYRTHTDQYEQMYMDAVDLYENGSYPQAYDALMILGGYRDARDLAEQARSQYHPGAEP